MDKKKHTINLIKVLSTIIFHYEYDKKEAVNNLRNYCDIYLNRDPSNNIIAIMLTSAIQNIISLGNRDEVIKIAENVSSIVRENTSTNERYNKAKDYIVHLLIDEYAAYSSIEEMDTDAKRAGLFCNLPICIDNTDGGKQ